MTIKLLIFSKSFNFTVGSLGIEWTKIVASGTSKTGYFFSKVHKNKIAVFMCAAVSIFNTKIRKKKKKHIFKNDVM